MMYFKENGLVYQNDDDDDDDDEECFQNVDQTTPMRHQNPSSTLSGSTKGTDTSNTGIIQNSDTNNGHVHFNNDKNCTPTHNNFRGRFSKISNNNTCNTCINDDDGDDDTSSNTDDDDGGISLPIVSSTSSRFSTLTKNLPLFLTKKRKIREKKVKQKSESKLSCSQKIEAVLVGLAAFLTNAIIIGFAGSLGIYYVEFKQYFVENHGLITFSVFLPTGVFGSVGLLAGLFMNKFGVRITGVSGSILLTIGIGTCFFAHSVVFLLPFLGVFAGIGCSLVYLTVSMSMCNYFQHKGRLLMPLITMGEGVGTIIFPIITTYFINVYSWRGSMLMMAGVMLQAAVCVFMYSIKNRKQHKANTSDRKQEDAKSLQPSNGVDSNFGTHSNSNLQTQTNIIPASFQTDSMPEKQPENRFGSVSDPTVSIIQNYKTENGDRKEGNLQVSVNGFLANESQELKVPDLLSNFEAEKNTKVIVEDKKIPPIDIFLSILKDEQYVLFLISVCIISGSIHTTLTLLPDFCVSKGLTLMHGAHVYAIGASGDIMARLFGSWLLYKHNTSSLMIYTLSGIVLSMLIAIYPLLSKFSLLSTLSFFVMTFCGLIFSVYNVVILDFFDLKMYAIAMGMSETVAGIGIVIIGYGIGLVTEYNEGNYSISFFLLGGLTMISMLPMIILYVKKYRPSASYNLS